MKRLKLFFACMLLTVFSIGQVWATEFTVSWAASSGALGSAISAVNGTATGTIATTDGGSTSYDWSYTRTLVYLKSGKSDYVSFSSPNLQLGSSNAGETLSLTTSEIPGTIKSVTVGCWSKNGNHTLAITVGGDSYYSGATPSATGNTEGGTGTSSGEISIEFSISTANALYISSIEVVYEVNTSTPSVSVTPSSWDFGTVHASDAASKVFSVSGSNLTAGDLTLTVPIGFSVTPKSIAVDGTLDATNVTVSKNTSTIDDYSGDLSISGGGLSTAKTVALTMTVDADPAPTGTFKLFSGDIEEGDYVICSGTTALKNELATNTNYIGYETVTVSAEKITNPSNALIWHVAPVSETDYWTIYNATANIYAASTGAKNKGQVIADGTDDKAMWTASGTSSYEFVNKANTAASVNSNLRYNSGYGFACYGTGTGAALTLYKLDDGTPSAPTFSPAAGSFLEAQSVTLSAEAGAEIYYTMGENPADPTSGSTHYTGAIAVSSTTTIKAIAVNAGVSSNVASATYTIVATDHAGTAEDPYSVADAKIVIDAVGTKENAYVAGKICTIQTTFLPAEGFITFFISVDGTTTGQQIEAYKCKSLNGAAFTALTDVETGASVVITGTLKKYNSTYEFDQNCHLVSYEAPTAPKQSIANDQANPYTVAQALVYAADGVTYDLDDYVYVRGVVYKVESFNNGAMNIFIKDANAENSFELYKCAGINDGNTTTPFEALTDVQANDVVIGYGQLTVYQSVSEFKQGNYLVDLDRPAVPSITADPEAVTNVAAEGVTNQTIALTYENIENYSANVALYADATAETAFSGSWLTASISANYATVTYSVAANDGEARTAYIKVHATGDNSKEAAKIIAVSQVEYVAPAAPAELPFAFNGGRNDIANTQGMSQEGLGSDYNNSPKLKFDGTGDVVIINIAAAPGKLTFDITGNGFSGGTFTVQESEDGITYTDVVAYTELGAKSNKEETLAQATRFVKFIYTEKSSGNVALGNITIAEYVAPAAVEAPTFSVAEGTYLGAQSVELSCATGGATIYYTMGADPADPTSGSTEYTGAIPVSSTTTIKAIAIKGSDESAIASATYTIVNVEHAGTAADPYSVADARTVIDAGVGVTGVYATGIVSEIVEAYSSQYHNITYNISADGLTTSDQLQAFRGKDKDGANFTSEDDVQVGDVVVIYGDLKKYEETYEFDQNNQRYSFNRPGDPVLQSIAISEAPTKTTYDVGDVFDVTGLVVTGTYDQGAPAPITAGITWEVRTNSTSEAVALASYTLTKDQTALQVRATVGTISSGWYDVTGLTVKEHEITPGAYDITLANALWGTSYTSSTTSTTANALDLSGSSNDIQVSLTNGSSTNMYITNDGTRAYTGYTLTFAVPTGYEITKITFTKATKWGLSAESGLNSNAEWTGKANSISFSFTARTDLTTVNVTFAAYVPATVATPTFSPVAGTYPSAQNVTITCETDGATIYYTTDDSNPDNTSTQYTGAITVDESMTIKAIAYKDNEHSEVATAAYTISIPETPVSTTSKWVPATAADLVDGKVVLITGTKESTTYAMGEQKTSNRAAVAASVDGEGVLTPGENTMAFTLVDQGNNTFALRTADGQYLYAASSSANHLKKRTAIGDDNNAIWTVAVDALTANGSNRGVMQFNYSTTNQLFSCYASASSSYIAIKLYVPQPAPTPTKDLIRDGLTNGKWGTICPKQTVENVEGAKFYQISYLEEQNGVPFNMVWDEISGTTLTAGQPYFFIANATEIRGNKTSEVASSGSNKNGFYGYIGDDVMHLPYLADYDPNDNNTFVIYNNKVTRINGATDLNSERCYININASEPTRTPKQPSTSLHRLTMSISGADAPAVTTGINEITNDQMTNKVIINGHLFIIRGEKMFDATGRLVK